MGLALKLYEELIETTDERARLRLIADAIGTLEERWPAPDEIARRSDVREAELRLQKEIEGVRKEIMEIELGLKKEIKEVELGLKKEIKVVEIGMKEIELRLQKEIEQVRGDIVRSKNDLLKWLVPLMLGQVAAIVALVKIL